MINFFLKLKHWQLFTLMVGLPFLFQILTMVSMVSNLHSDSPQTFNSFGLFPLIMVIFFGTFFGWFWSIVMGLQTKLPTGVDIKTTRFKIFFFIPLIYMTCISVFMTAIFNGMAGAETAGFIDIEGPGIALILLLHLLAMFGIFHTLYFVAKTIKTVERQKEVSFSEFAGEFFMLWIYFVGIWIIQPKINALAEGKNNDLESF